MKRIDIDKHFNYPLLILVFSILSNYSVVQAIPWAVPENHEPEATSETAVSDDSNGGQVRFTKDSGLYKSIMELIRPVNYLETALAGTPLEANLIDTRSFQEKQKAGEELKKLWQNVSSMAANVAIEDQKLFSAVSNEIQTFLENSYSPVLKLEKGELKKAFEEVFPKAESVFAKQKNNYQKSNSQIDHAEHTIERIKSWEKRLNDEPDPLKRLILTYTLHGEWTTLAEMRPKALKEMNSKKPKNESEKKKWEELKSSLENYYKQFQALQEGSEQLATFQLTEKDDIKDLLGYERALNSKINSRSTDQETKERALALRSALLAAIHDQKKLITKHELWEQPPYNSFKKIFEQKSQENERLLANIKKTNEAIQIAENTKKDISKQTNSDSRVKSIQAAIERINNETTKIKNNLNGPADLGPNLKTSYEDSIKQLGEQKASLESLLDSVKKETLANSNSVASNSASGAQQDNPSREEETIATAKRAVQDRLSGASGATHSTSQGEVPITESSSPSGDYGLDGYDEGRKSLGRNILKGGMGGGLVSSGPVSRSLASKVALSDETQIGNRSDSSFRAVTPQGTNNGIGPVTNIINSAGVPAVISSSSAQGAATNKPETAQTQGLSAAEDNSWFDSEGISLRQKENLIKEGKATRRGSSNFANISNSDGGLVNYSNSAQTWNPSSESSSQGAQKESKFVFNDDGTFSPESIKRRSATGNESSSVGGADSELSKIAQTDMFSGINLANAESAEVQQEPVSLWEKLGLEPTLDSLSKFFEDLFPSKEFSSTNISELLNTNGVKLSNKRFNRELSTVDPLKAQRVKAAILAEAKIESKQDFSFWERLIAWLRS